MSAPPEASQNGGQSPAAPARKPPVDAVLKWIAAATAVLTLVGGSFQVTRLVSDVRERMRFIAESLDVANRQQAGGDYASAWATIEAGLKSADDGGQFAKLFGQLSRERRDLRQAQEDLAMLWLRNVQVPSGSRFSAVVDRLLPVLERGAAATQGIARADRIAHIGWAYFLKLRDGAATLDPAAQYRLALQSDPDNPYAHAFWGHWMVWLHQPLGDAMKHFEAAAKKPASLDFVRALAIAALRGRADDAARAQLVRWVDEMWRNGETVGPGPRNDLYDVYSSIVLAGAPAREYAEAVPPEEHVELIDELASAPDVDPYRVNVLRAARALFQEQARDTEDALATWRDVRANVGPHEGALRARAETSIRRLKAPKRNR
jgi:hypothetical protein